jgi:hypothetical protein
MGEIGETIIINKVGAHEIHTSSAYKPGEREKELARVGKQLEKLQKKIPLEKFRIDLNETVFKEPFESIKNDLTSLYLSTGLEITEENFPSVAVYNTRERRVSKACGGFGAGRAGFGNRVDLFPAGGRDNPLPDIRMLHHEIHHHLGRQVVVSRMAEKNLLGIKWKNPEITSTQLGFAHHLSGSDERGLVLEEGAVEYFSLDFILSSSNVDIIEARKQYAREATGNNTDNLDNHSIRNICKDELEKDTLPRYATARLLIETLIEGARKIGDDEAIEMRRDILKTRIDTKNTRSLMDRVDKIFGNGTFSEAFYLKFNGDKANEERNKHFVDNLREKAGLSSP